jgi:hypothetical protein
MAAYVSGSEVSILAHHAWNTQTVSTGILTAVTCGIYEIVVKYGRIQAAPKLPINKTTLGQTRIDVPSRLLGTRCIAGKQGILGRMANLR